MPAQKYLFYYTTSVIKMSSITTIIYPVTPVLLNILIDLQIDFQKIFGRKFQTIL